MLTVIKDTKTNRNKANRTLRQFIFFCLNFSWHEHVVYVFYSVLFVKYMRRCNIKFSVSLLTFYNKRYNVKSTKSTNSKLYNKRNKSEIIFEYERLVQQ